MKKKRTETPIVQEIEAEPVRYVPPFLSKNMLHVKHLAWRKNVYWTPAPAVIDAALAVKHCLERLGLNYE